jgi:sec-independent protein translocase protein TatB
MFGIGMPELIVIAVVALIVLGPNKLPELAKSMGRAMREFKKATSELRESLQIDEDVSEVKKAFQDFQTDVNTTIRDEEKRPEAAAAEKPAPEAGTAQSEAEPTAPAAMADLKKAFDAWNSSDAAPVPDPGSRPGEPQGPRSAETAAHPPGTTRTDRQD